MASPFEPPTDFEPFERRDRELERAARSIIAQCRSDRFGRGWRPKGVDEIAILLESLGFSQEIVSELWYPDLFALARDVNVLIEKYVSDEERARERDLSWFRLACRDYAIGSLYSGPWIIAVIGLAVFGASLWSSLSTPLHLATAIALGVYVAQLVSGFYAQAIARRLTFYVLQENAPLMRWTFERFIALAIATTALASALLWLALRAWVGDPDAWLAASFCAGSALFQLALAPLYTLRRFAWIIGVAFAATLATGLTFVLGFHRQVDLPWEPATLALEIGCIGVLVLAVTHARLASAARRTHGELVAPSTRSIVQATLPYAAFGAVYFAAILCDRVFAGIAAAGGGYAYAAAYELGADIALLAILPVTGVVNVVLEALPRRILAGADARVTEIEPFQRGMLRFYLLGLGAIALATLAAIALGEFGGTWLVLSAHLGGGDASSLAVLHLTTIGYAVVMVGLLNVQILFFLSRPGPALLAACGALAASLAWCAVAVLRGAAPAQMAWGLIAAACVFAALSTISTARAMRGFTYAYYAAY